MKSINIKFVRMVYHVSSEADGKEICKEKETNFHRNYHFLTLTKQLKC